MISPWFIPHQKYKTEDSNIDTEWRAKKKIRLKMQNEQVKFFED